MFWGGVLGLVEIWELGYRDLSMSGRGYGGLPMSGKGVRGLADVWGGWVRGLADIWGWASMPCRCLCGWARGLADVLEMRYGAFKFLGGEVRGLADVWEVGYWGLLMSESWGTEACRCLGVGERGLTDV
ncbi:hypothetical protein DPMN_162114 [Dreissena polymorpha]|uniref:Uncharacterized protein n=1 Tax=Dreissena polymorpha TaxID=45954 RepID=A0A9D4ITC9_DREPO|nr:hypothetical protein DPMN_162114 [Dreissena polymorpha]